MQPKALRIASREASKVITPKEHEAWIRKQRCYLCSPKSTPRGPSEFHHVGTGDDHRRSLILGIPGCRHHHQLLTDEPHLEYLLRVREVALYLLKMHLFEKGLGEKPT